MSTSAPSILESIASKSDADARRLIQIGERVAQRDEEAARKAAGEREAARDRESQEQAASQKALAGAQAQAQAERMKLAFRQKLVERLLAESLAQLKGMPRDEAYMAILQQLAVEAADLMGVGQAILSSNSRDREFVASDGRFDRIASAVRERKGMALTLAEQSIEAAGGVVLTSPDGRVSYYNTFDEIAYRRRSELKGLIAQKLFG